jgi:hypothetical protein
MIKRAVAIRLSKNDSKRCPEPKISKRCLEPCHLVYSQPSTLEDANKVYQLLRINDPELPVRILKY